MNKNTISIILVAFFSQFVANGAESATHSFRATAGELEVLSENKISIKVMTKGGKLPAYGEKNPKSSATYEVRVFTINSTTKCFDADESSASKFNKTDSFMVYKKIAKVPCASLSARKMATIYHLENKTVALAIRDNGFPRIPIFGFGASASPITNKDGAAFVMQMQGTISLDKADPVILQLQK